MARDIQLIKLNKDKAPVGDDCAQCGIEIEQGDYVQIFGNGDAYCSVCQEERAEERDVAVIYNDKSEKKARKDKKAGKKKTRKNVKKAASNKGEKLLDLGDEEEEEEQVTAAGLSELEIKNIATEITNNGMRMLRAKIKEELEIAFKDMVNPVTGELPELATGQHTFIRKVAEQIWTDGYLFKQLDTKNGRVEAHTTPDESLDVCPATTADGEPCQNKPKAEKVYCGSHKKHEKAAAKSQSKKGKKAVEKRTVLSVE